MKKKRTRAQKEKLALKRKSQVKIKKTDANQDFLLDKKQISQDLIKTVWVTILILLILLLIGFNNF